MKLKESDDMRAPLAFLLGKLDFQKEFRNLQAKAEGTDTRITAEPKTDNLPYSAVEFVVAADQHIKGVKVTGFDHSILEFRFDQEKVDPPLDAKLFQFQAPKAHKMVDRAVAMADFVLKYADGRGEIHQQVARGSEKEVRERFAQQGFLIYSIRPGPAACEESRFLGGRKKLNLEKFLIFNQQFVTLIRAGLPILKAFDLLADRLTDPKLGPAHQDRPRRSAQRHAALRSLSRAGDIPQDLRDVGDGGREERQPGARCWTATSPTRSCRSRCARRSWFRCSIRPC